METPTLPREGHPGHFRFPLWISSQGGTSCDRMQLASIGSPKLFSHRLYADCDDVLDTAPSLRELKTWAGLKVWWEEMSWKLHGNPFPALSSSVAVQIISCPGEQLFQGEDTKRVLWHVYPSCASSSSNIKISTVCSQSWSYLFIPPFTLRIVLLFGLPAVLCQDG